MLTADPLPEQGELWLSVVFTAHAAGLDLVRNSVFAALDQTAPASEYEVVVGVDARAEIDARLFRDELPPSVRVGHCLRERAHEELPHRNHARNTGLGLARGQYVWVLDGDMMMPRHAVDHLRQAVEQSPALRVISPCFGQPRIAPDEWPSYVRAVGLERALRVDAMEQYQASGFFDRVVESSDVSLMRCPGLVEGFPALTRKLLDALGGYPEVFLGYGGNKHDVTRQLCALDRKKLLEIHIMTSVCFAHQPHERDPGRVDRMLRSKNTAIFNQRGRDIAREAPWWRDTVQRVKSAHTSLPDAVSAA